MSCYVVTQSFFNSGLGAEGKLGEYLEMSKNDASRIGKRYLETVSKDTQEGLKARRIAPRAVTLIPEATLEVPDISETVEKKAVKAGANKMVRGGKNK